MSEQPKILVIPVNRRGQVDAEGWDSDTDLWNSLRVAVRAASPADARDKETVLRNAGQIVKLADKQLAAGANVYEGALPDGTSVRFCRPDIFRKWGRILAKTSTGPARTEVLPPRESTKTPYLASYVADRLRVALEDSRNLPIAYPFLADAGLMERTPNGFVAQDPETLQRKCRELRQEMLEVAQRAGFGPLQPKEGVLPGSRLRQGSVMIRNEKPTYYDPGWRGALRAIRAAKEYGGDAFVCDSHRASGKSATVLFRGAPEQDAPAEAVARPRMRI